MNGLQMWYALASNDVTSKHFDGVFASDTLHKIIKRPKLIVCNTEESYKEGEHWLVFYFTDNNIELFDSLGKNITDYNSDIVAFTKRFHGSVVNVLDKRIQPNNTSLCGHYCLLYAWCRCRGQSKDTFKDNVPPPSFVEYFVTLIFDISKVSSSYQCCKYC